MKLHSGMPRILIIDDNLSVLQSLDIYFKMEGFAVLLASDGPSGIQQATSNPVDLVLLDVEMPRMSGIEVCRTIRADPALCHLPVVIMTGRATRDVVARAKEAGASGVMAKPFDLVSLRAKIDELLMPAVGNAGAP